MAIEDRTSHITKPLNDAYTGMLAISLLALILGCTLLFLDYQSYQGQTVPTISTSPSAPIPKRAPDVEAPKEKEKEKEQPADKGKDKEKENEGG